RGRVEGRLFPGSGKARACPVLARWGGFGGRTGAPREAGARVREGSCLPGPREVGGCEVVRGAPREAGSGDVGEGVPDVFGLYDREAGGEGDRADRNEGALAGAFAVAFVEGAERDEAAFEAEAGRFGEAAADVLDRAELACEAD